MDSTASSADASETYKTIRRRIDTDEPWAKTMLFESLHAEKLHALRTGTKRKRVDHDNKAGSIRKRARGPPEDPGERKAYFARKAGRMLARHEAEDSARDLAWKEACEVYPPGS